MPGPDRGTITGVSVKLDTLVGYVLPALPGYWQRLMCATDQASQRSRMPAFARRILPRTTAAVRLSP
jgi:hypothetical protein